jgi:sortase A
MPEILFSMRSKRRARSVRLAHALSWLLVALGALALADAAVTLAWREPITALIATLREGGLESQLRHVEAASPSQAEREALLRIKAQRRRVRFLARRMEAAAPYGSAVGKIVIPHVGADFVLVKGSGESELELGPGTYTKSQFPATSFPGAGGITAIAGHRTTWLEPFRHIDELRRGDRIFVTMPYGRFAYLVTHDEIVPEADVAAVLAPDRSPHVVLSACYPLFSAEKRILVFARLVSVKPRGAALIHSPRKRHGVFGATLSSSVQLREGTPARSTSAPGGSAITSGARSRAPAPLLPRS